MDKIKIYTKAIELLENQDSEEWCGLCHAITEAILILEHSLTYEEAQNEHYYDIFNPTWEPVIAGLNGHNGYHMEIHAYKPEEKFEHGYWFNPLDRISRIKILNKVIAELEGK